MVFPSLFFQNDPGIVSQASGLVILAFSLILHRFKRMALLAMSFIVAGWIAFRILG